MREVLGRRSVAGDGRGRQLRGGAVAFLVAAAFGIGDQPARAQQSAAPAAGALESPVEEVLVTARKRSESIQDIPASVQAIPESIIKDNHMTQLDDIGSLVSNLNIFEAHDNSPAVVMRGVGSFELVPGVGFYMDDVQLFEGQTVRPNDIARIEVLKGPQGTLYGGANIGGAIKYVTKEPTRTWQNEVTAELGNYKTRNIAAAFSGPLADKLGMRLSVYDDNHGGYITDTYHNETIGASHDRGGRLVFKAEPQDATTVRLSFNADSYDSQNENLQYRVTEVGFASAPYTADAYRYSVDDFFIPSFIRKLFSTTLQVQHQVGSGIEITSITNQFWSYNRGITDFTKQPKPIDLLFQNQDHRVLSQELRLASTGHTNLDWLVGLFAQRHVTDLQNSDSLYTGDIPPQPDTPSYDYDVQNKVQKQYAVFGDATYHMGNWQYELGLRAERFSSTLHTQSDGGDGNVLFLGPQDLTGHQISPRASIGYKVRPGTNLYATVARGFEPADLTEQNGGISTIQAETATNYELGVKSQLPHGIQLNVAVYLMDYKNRLYQTFVATPGGFQDITTNIGPSRNTGIEVEFLVPLTSEFKLNGGFGTTRAVWGDARYGDPQLTAMAGGVNPVFRNLNGLRAPFTPEYSANLSLHWDRLFSNGFKVGAHLDGSAVGESYWDPNDFARQKAYQLMNAGAHLDTGNVSLIANVTNLTGTRYNTMYWDNMDVGGVPPVGGGTPPFHSFGRINRPRTFSLSATYFF